MIEICYKTLCVILGLFILSLFLYQTMKNNNIYKVKILEGIDLSEDEISKMTETVGKLEDMKIKQANIINNITSVKTNTAEMKNKLSGINDDIQKNLKKSEKQAEDAKKGKNVCPPCPT